MTTAFQEQQLRTLTEKGIAFYGVLNRRDQDELGNLRTLRAGYEAEIASIDVVMRDLEATIDRRAATARGDFISLLPSPVPMQPLSGPQGDPDVHASLFGGTNGDAHVDAPDES